MDSLPGSNFKAPYSKQTIKIQFADEPDRETGVGCSSGGVSLECRSGGPAAEAHRNKEPAAHFLRDCIGDSWIGAAPSGGLWGTDVDTAA